MEEKVIRIRVPVEKNAVEKLKAGDRVLISGVMLTGRDAAHKRLFELIRDGRELPVEISGQFIYYTGPTPAKPGQITGSAGPTTSGRMDAYAPALMEKGLKGMIGKGARDEKVKQAMKDNRAVYLAAIGGAGALISKCIVKSEVAAYEDLGPEAIRRIEVVDFPAVVINDIYGGDLYEQGRKKYASGQDHGLVPQHIFRMVEL